MVATNLEFQVAAFGRRRDLLHQHRFIGPDMDEVVPLHIAVIAARLRIPERTMRHYASTGKIQAHRPHVSTLHEGEPKGWYATIWDAKVGLGLV